MTNAIEQSKREMYEILKHVNRILGEGQMPVLTMPRFETALESYLELLRQDHEALHETARKRFEDIQSLEAVNKSLSAGNAWLNQRCEALVEKCDSLRNRQQASDHAQGEAPEKGATLHQSSAENVSCATLDGKTAAILGALVDAQRVMTDYLVPDGIRAKDAIGKMIPILDNERLYTAMREFESPPIGGYAAWFISNIQCQHRFHPAFPSGEQCVFCGVGK